MKLNKANIKLLLKALWLIAFRTLFKPKKKRPFKETVAILYQLGIKVSVFVSLFLVVVQSIKEVVDDKVVFVPFKVPPALEEQGYVGEIFVSQIANHIDLIRRDVERNDKENFITIAAFDDSQDIEIPGAGISLKDITGFLRGFFGTSVRNISGSVVLQEDKLQLTVNMSGRAPYVFEGSLADLSEMIRKAAVHILKNMDPFTLGKYYNIKKDEASMLALAKHIRDHYADESELVTAHLIEGLYYYNRGRYEDALYEWESATINDPENLKALLYQGWALDELGRFDEAVALYRKIVEIDPKNPGAYNNWAIVLYKMSKSDEAIKKFQKLVEVSPDYAKGYNNWGYLLFEYHEYEKGIEMIKKAIRLDPKNPDFYESLAEGYLKVGKNREAIAQIKQALRLNPKAIRVYHTWAEALARMDRFDEAYEKYLIAKGKK
ncbi:conserved hypothetical protein [Candidatus Desulfarcum epimagneticum]|uniref:Uncharacterized protein n=1 Tax=uncultured Desulfobacteraceae bacterium TaxID=218296 RepID=A0A484HDK1_9BACT|nr:conserved hypothetical protein [uncultured Desulfobacteraceae bacterium]